MKLHQSKKIDVILIQPPRYKRRPSKRSQPQLGLAYIASFLLSKRLRVKVIDGLSSNRSVANIVEEVCTFSPLAVGITTVCEDRFNAVKLANRIKSKLKKTLVFAGGPQFSYSPVDALIHVPGIDVIAIGEGEITSWELIQTFLKSGNTHSFHNVDSCAFRDKNGEIIVTPRRFPIIDIDKLPGPAWHLFDMDKYHGTLSGEEKTRAIGVISSRGCPNQCVFCSNSLNRRVRYRNPKLFVNEVKFLHKQYGFPGLNFQDDSFTSNAKHVTQVCEEMLRRDIKIRWYCSLRINNVSMDLLKLMKEAGCVSLGYGIETGSDRLLKIIKKGITTDQIREAIKITKKVGFKHVTPFLMTSLPGQTLEEIRISSEFLSEIESLFYNRVVYQVYIGTPTLIYPGTEIEKMARQNGNVFPTNFSWYTYYKTDKAKVFNSNPYVPHFENPHLSLEEIKKYTQKLRLQWRFLKYFNTLTAVRTPKELGQLTTKAFQMLYRSLKKHTISSGGTIK